MREIKFRGKYNGDWKYGLLGMSGLSPAIIDGVKVWPVDSSTVGQFTGMKTNNGVDGVELYEGDVVNMSITNKDTGTRGVICYVDNLGCYCVVKKDFSGIVASLNTGFVLLGNLFDNRDFRREFAEVYADGIRKTGTRSDE